MRDRTFGVEIECGYSGTGSRHECNCSECGWYDYHDFEDRGISAAIDLLHRNGFRDWANQDIHCDGSGVEIPSPVLRGQKGLNELQQVMGLLKSNGFYVSREDGMHVHHGAEEFVDDVDLCVALVEAWNANQELISEFVAEDRRRDHWACATWSSNHIEDLKQTANRLKNGQPAVDRWGYAVASGRAASALAYAGPRGALNLGSLSEHGTIEIRQHEGTLEFSEAYAWIHFGQAFIDSVVKGRVRTCGSSTSLLNNIQVSPKSKELLLAKAAA